MRIECLNNKRGYIFGFGVAGKWLASNSNFEVLGFIDNNLKKNGRTFNSHKVISPVQAKKIIKKTDVIVNTVLDIQDVVTVIEKHFPQNQAFALGQFLNNEKVGINQTNESDEFLEYTLKAVEMCHKSYLGKNRKFIHSLDVVISEKCSLNCKDCSNLMQYYKSPKNLTYESVVADFEALVSKLDHIYEIRLIGGEPFMNKEIYKIIDYFIASKVITKLVVYTNATIPLKKNLMSMFKTPKLVFSITDYGNLSRNTKRVTEALDEMSIAYRCLPPSNWTDSGRMQNYKRSIDDMKNIFEKCCGKNLFTLMYGKLYRCPFSANAERLKGIPIDKANSVEVGGTLRSIDKYTNNIKYLPACNFCNGRSHDAPEIVPAIQAPEKLQYKIYTDNEV